MGSANLRRSTLEGREAIGIRTTGGRSSSRSRRAEENRRGGGDENTVRVDRRRGSEHADHARADGDIDGDLRDVRWGGRGLAATRGVGLGLGHIDYAGLRHLWLGLAGGGVCALHVSEFHGIGGVTGWC